MEQQIQLEQIYSVTIDAHPETMRGFVCTVDQQRHMVSLAQARSLVDRLHDAGVSLDAKRVSWNRGFDHTSHTVTARVNEADAEAARLKALDDQRVSVAATVMAARLERELAYGSVSRSPATGRYVGGSRGEARR